MNKRECAHGFELDSRGFHIHNSEKEKSTAELIEEANKLFQTPKTVPVKTEEQKALEESKQRYEKYFQEKQNQGIISPSWFPKTFFDKHEE
jgi:hypothetical protein